MTRKLRIKIHHLPSGEKFYTDTEEFNEEEEEHMVKILTRLAGGKLEHLDNYMTDSDKFKMKKEFWFLPENVIQQSAIYLEVVK